jgi:hypothetical protein
MSNLFHTLEIEAFRKGLTLRTKESQDWFRRKASQLGKVNRNDLMKEEPVGLRNRTAVGHMYHFFYDPKHKKTLPYYDTFPLVIVLGPAEGGFLGLNLHYLPPVLRAKFLDGLMDVTNNRLYDEKTKFELSYKMLQGATKMKYFKPCVKHYLKNHVRSRFAKIEAPEWEISVFLPTADFQKASQSTVWKDSRRKINGA